MSKVFVVLGVILFLGMGSLAVYSFMQYQSLQKELATLKSSGQTSKAEAQETIDAVSKLILLPKEETPTIATVTDSKKLQTQSFFSKASNGDKVLIYAKSKKAILYNPAQKKVIEVSAVNFGTTNKAEVAGTTAQQAKAPAPSIQQRQVTITPSSNR